MDRTALSSVPVRLRSIEYVSTQSSYFRIVQNAVEIRAERALKGVILMFLHFYLIYPFWHSFLPVLYR